MYLFIKEGISDTDLKNHGYFKPPPDPRSDEVISRISCQRLNISEDVKLLFLAKPLGFPVIRHFHAPRCPRKKQKQATLEFQYKTIGKTLLEARKLTFLQKLPNRLA